MPQLLASEEGVNAELSPASVERQPVAHTARGLDMAEDTLPQSALVSLDTEGQEPTDPLQSALVSSVSGFSVQSMHSSPAVDMGLSGKRLFLDICSGATRPLSQAALDVGMQVLSVDPLCAGKLDLFNNVHYEPLLRISFSGIVWFACASPPCGDFSTIKLRIPDATASQSARIRSSLCLLERAVSLLLAVFQAGGHASLEQPPNALSWRQSMVQHYLLEVSASCCCVAACAFGLNVHKRWMFATSFAGLSALACVCEHERSAHIDVAGKRLEDGTYLSRGTAEYPASLASAFIQIIRHMGDVTGPQDYALHDAIKLVPGKQMDALPVAFQDGGGLGSSPDWSRPPQGKENLLLPLRQRWREMLFKMGFPQRLRLHIASGADTCPFSDQEIQQFRRAFDEFAAEKGVTSVSWDVPSGQPCCLEALHSLSRLLSDKDVALFPALSQGVPTGYDKDIPASNVFAPRPSDAQPDAELQICEGNWAGAEADPQLLLKLVQSELDAGYLLEVPLDKALATWGSKVAF